MSLSTKTNIMAGGAGCLLLNDIDVRIQQIAKVLQQIDITTLYECIILREILRGINFRDRIPTRKNLYPQKNCSRKHFAVIL